MEENRWFFASLVTTSVDRRRVPFNALIKINRACLPHRVQKKRIYRRMRWSYIVGKISMDICSLKADVRYYLTKCLLCPSKKSLSFIWITKTKVKISLVLIKQKFFIDIQWEIRIKIYTNLILLPTIVPHSFRYLFNQI